MQMRMTSLLDIYSPAYGETWDKAFTICRDDGEVVDNLIKEHIRHGDFRENVVLADPSEEPYVWDGMHRITALYDMGIPLVPFQYGYSTDSGRDFYLEIELAYKAGEHIWDIYEENRSYPLNSDFWVNIESMSSTENDESIELNLTVVLTESELKKYRNEIVDSIYHRFYMSGIHEGFMLVSVRRADE